MAAVPPARRRFPSARARLSWWFALCACLCASAVYAEPVLVAPRPIESVDGTWPEGALATYDAVVPLRVTVDESGRVREASVDVSVAPALDRAAVLAGRRWRFFPATRDGVAIAAHTRIAVRFAAATLDAGVAHGAAGIDAGSGRGLDAGGEWDENANEEFVAHARVEQLVESASELTRDGRALRAAPHRTASEQLREVPGLFLTQHSGEGKAHQLFYRGFDAVHGQDLELWVGGAPVNDVSNLHGQGYADLNFVMPEVVRSLHVQPGSYDPRQGDFAVAGSARFELGYDQPGLTAKAGYGSFGTSRYFLAYRPKDADESTFGAAEFYGTDGFGPARSAKRASAIAQGSWRLATATRARLLLTGYTGHFDSAGVLPLADLQAKRIARYATYDARQGGASSRVQLVAELTHNTPSSTLSFAPYLVLRTLRLRQNNTGFLLDPSGDSLQQLNDALVVGGRAWYRLRKHVFSPRDRFELGVAVRSDWIEQSQRRLASVDDRVLETQVDARVHALDIAGYLDAALHPLSWLTLHGGVRLDGLSYRTVDQGAAADGQARASQGLHVGEKASLALHALPGLDLIGSYGAGFRSPQARSLAESERTPFTRVRSCEGGVRYASDWLALSAAGFRTWLSDDLVFDQASGRNDAVPATARTGATADLTLRPEPWIALNLNGTYTRAVFRAGNEDYQKGDLVPYAPQIVARAALSLTPTLWSVGTRTLRAELGGGASYLARRPLPYAQFGHRIFLLDAQARLRFGELALALTAFNLLDTAWYDGEFAFASNWHPEQAATLVPARHVTVGAPRTLFASLELYL